MLDLDQRIDDLDEVLTARLHRHRQAKILTSLPGIGVLGAAEFLVAVGDLASFASANHLAAYAAFGAGPLGFGSPPRRPALTPALQPHPAARLLPLCPDQRATSRPVAGLLPAQTPAA